MKLYLALELVVNKQGDIIFLKKDICILRFNDVRGKNLWKEVLTSKSTFKNIPLNEINWDSYFLIPKNSLNYVKLDCNQISNILKIKTNEEGFKSLSTNTKITIQLRTMMDLESFDKFYEFVPDHAELEFKNFPIVILFKFSKIINIRFIFFINRNKWRLFFLYKYVSNNIFNNLKAIFLSYNYKTVSIQLKQ